MKSPGFSDFRPYKSTFEEYLSSGLGLHLYQLEIDSYQWQKGPRLGMNLKLFPVYEVNNQTSNTFNRSEVQRIMGMFTAWEIPDSELFGPYELLKFTLLDPYQEGSCLNPYSICFSTEFYQIKVKLILKCETCLCYCQPRNATE